MATKINNGGYQQPMDPRTGKFMSGKTTSVEPKRMKFIQNSKKLNQIKKLAKNGDKEAKDFLFGFRDMEEEKVNAYLDRFNDIKDNVIVDLIKLEENTIEEYKKAIEEVENKEPLEKIVKEKEVHILVLKEMLKDGIEE